MTTRVLGVVAALVGVVLLVWFLNRGKEITAPAPAPDPAPAPAADPPSAKLQALVVKVNRLRDAAFEERDLSKLRQAASLLQAALPRTQERDRVYTMMAFLELARGDFQSTAGKTPPPAVALKYAQAALKENPKNWRALEALAMYHDRRNAPADALEAYERILRLDPNNGLFIILKSKSLYELGRYTEAEGFLKKELLQARARDDNEQLIKAQELLGMVYIKQGKYKLAEEVLLSGVETLKRAKHKLANCPYMALSQLYLATGDREKVAVNTKKAADWEPRRPGMQFNAAKEFLAVGDTASALTYIDRALALRDDPDYHALKTRIQASHGATGAAAPHGPSAEGQEPASPRRAFRSAMESFEKHRFEAALSFLQQAQASGVQARHRVLQGFILLLKSNPEEAAKLFAKAGKQDRDDSGAEVGMGHLAIIRRDYLRARNRLLPAVKKQGRLFGDPGRTLTAAHPYPWLVYRMACLGMGWVAANQNKHTLALTYFERVLTHKKDDIFSLLGKGNSLNALNLLQQAERTMNRVLELDPKNRHAMANLALVKYNRDQDAEAERLFKAALKQGQGRYTCPHEGLGMVYLRAGRIAEAKASFNKAITINPHIEYKKFNGLAKIMIREGNYKKARSLLRKSIKNYPYDGEAKKLLTSLRGRVDQ